MPALSRNALITGDADPTVIVQVETQLLPSDPAQAAKFGSSVAISGDVLVAAAPSWNIGGSQSEGGVYVFVRDPETGQWLEQKKLIPRNSALEWSFTAAIDGDTVAIGVPYSSAGRGFQRGAVYIFERHQGGTDNWGEVAKLSGASLGDLAQFGSSLALAGDLLVVGAPEPSSIGQVVIFDRNRGGPNAWGQTTILSYNDDAGLSPEYFGVSLALDGDMLLVGATSADVSYYASNDGAAYLFQRDGVDRDRWDYVARLTEPEAALCTGGLTIAEMWSEPVEVQDAWTLCAQGDTATDNIGFGGNVALDGGTALVTSRGMVNVFQRDDTDAALWPRVAVLQSSDGAGFGRLALEGETLLVGASGTDVDASVDQGAVHVFRRDPATGAFTVVETLIAGDGLSDDHFGNSLALQGTTRVIAAYGRDGYRGAVYLHETGALPPPPSRCQPLVPPTDILEDAATVTHTSGFTVATDAGALATPLPIWIQEVAAPAAPLPRDAIAHGAYYSLGAECTTFTPPGKQFQLGLPVPESIDTSHLGAALLVPASSVLDRPSASPFWQPLDGIYDAERGLFIVAIAALVSEGNTLVLIEHPNLESGRVSDDAAHGASSREPEAIFDVRCGMTMDRAICTDQARADVNFALMEAYGIFQQQAFPEPYMGDSVLHQIGVRPYLVEIREESAQETDMCAGKLSGAYNFQTGSIAFCVPPTGPMPGWSALRGTARHELFHAIQYAYERVRSDARDSWVLEGTADAAVGWDGTMHRRANRALRRADITLTEGNPLATRQLAYRAQDFWVHLFVATGSDGLRRNHPLGLLDQFFWFGASTAAVATRLDDGSPAFDGLGDEYWAWAKNQVIEKTDVTFDGALRSPCTIEDTLIGEPLRVDYVGPTADDPTPFRLGGQFEHGLETQVVEITITEEVDNLTIRAAGGGDDLAYKVYLHGESDCRGPEADDGERLFDHPLPAGAIVFVVLANKRASAGMLPLAYEVEVSLTP